jgi:hypothetical protein
MVVERESKVSIVKADVQQELIEGYCRLLKSIGSVQEHDSVRYHLQFLAAMFPSKEKLSSKITTEAVKRR